MAEQITKTETIRREDTDHYDTDTGVTREKVTSYSVVYQVIYLIAGLIEGLLGLRFIFKLLGASRASGFVQFLYGFTDVFMQPFRFIFPVNTAAGAVLEWSVLVAIVIYALLAWTLVKILSILFTADTGV
jgi:hypothetical protein